jgi:hypothetical protein
MLFGSLYLAGRQQMVMIHTHRRSVDVPKGAQGKEKPS